MSDNYMVCRLCHQRKPIAFSSVCNVCVDRCFSQDNMATIQSTAKLLDLSTATLKRLDVTGQLVAERNKSGTRCFPRISVELYAMEREAKKNERFNKYVTDADPEVVTMEQYVPEIPCRKCNRQEVYDKGYCIECLSDFVSKGEAARILGVTQPSIDRLLRKYPEHLKAYPYMSQLRMSKKEVQLFKLIQPDMKTATQPKWSSHRRKCRNCGTTEKEHYGGGYCIDCYPKSNEAMLIEGYLGGENLAEIGKRLGFSRERARQLFNKAMAIDLEKLGKIPEYQRDEVLNQIELTHKQNRSTREFKQAIEDNYEDIINIVSTEMVTSELGLLKAIGLPASALYLINEEYSEFLEIISTNKNRWSWKYDMCKMCGTTSIKHKRWGYCENCYTKSNEWRDQQYRYRTNNYEKFRERQRAYESEYYKRPEVRKRMNERSYDKRYDGKREETIKLAHYKCEDCGMSRDQHKNVYSHDLTVFHINGNLSDNEQHNLVSLCKSCLAKRVRENMQTE